MVVGNCAVLDVVLFLVAEYINFIYWWLLPILLLPKA